MSKNRNERRTANKTSRQSGGDDAFQSILSTALQHHQAGQLAEAEQLYRQILALNPAHADALHLLGVLAHQVNQLDVAVELISKAIQIKNNVPAFYNNLGTTFQDQGKLDEAISSFKHALNLKSDYAEAHINLGNVFKQQGNFSDAIKHYERAIKLRPDIAETHNNLGTVFKSQRRLEDAIKSYKQALSIRPNYMEALNNIGNVFREKRDFDQALVYYRLAVDLNPSQPEVYNNIGTVLASQDRFDEALKSYKQALILQPNHAETLKNMGNLYKENGDPAEAVSYYQRAIAVNPHYAEAYNNMGATLKTLDKSDEAFACYKQAMAIDPNDADTLFNIGTLFGDQKKYAEAIQYLHQAIALRPDFVEAHINLGQMLNNDNNFDDAAKSYDRALALRPDSTDALNKLGNLFMSQGKTDKAISYYRKTIELAPNSPDAYQNLLLGMVYAASVSPEELFSEAENFGKAVANPLLRQRPLKRNINPERKIRIGYVSGDFYNHAVNFFFEPLLKLHSRKKFEIFAYSTSSVEDRITIRLKAEFDHWRNIKFLSDDQAADLIEADTIDILIDLSGHTAGSRLLLFARKPAPIQITWLGFPATTGMAAMDYRITDHYAEPEGLTEHLNTETLWRLPGMFCCYQAHERGAVVIDHPPSEDNGYITFGCFNNFAKVTDPVLQTWAQIMQEVPQSRLLLEIRGIESPQFRAEVEVRLQRLGLPLERVILEPRKPENQFVLYNRIDIALDPFPCVGGTTSMDTVWMGVPFVTLAGRHFASRMGVTILTNAGMPELIAKDADEYVRIAVGLATDKERLRGLRLNLRQKVENSPLMDQESFARNMEAA